MSCEPTRAKSAHQAQVKWVVLDFLVVDGWAVVEWLLAERTEMVGSEGTEFEEAPQAMYLPLALHEQRIETLATLGLEVLSPLLSTLGTLDHLRSTHPVSTTLSQLPVAVCRGVISCKRPK